MGVVGTPEYLEFSPVAPGEVVGTMEAMTRAHSGWINFEPAVDPDDVAAAGSGTFAIFSATGPAVPLGTWTPASAPRRGRAEPAMIGLQHGAGSKAKPALAELGRPVPPSWTVVQDHARKGLVVALPPGADHGEVLDWLLSAAVALSATPLTGSWRAVVYRA